MLGYSQFSDLETRPMDQQLPDFIAEQLAGMSFSVADVQLRPSRTSGVLVNVTLNRAANLNALFAAEQFLSPKIIRAMAVAGAAFFWRYRPQTNGVSA